MALPCPLFEEVAPNTPGVRMLGEKCKITNVPPYGYHWLEQACLMSIKRSMCQYDGKIDHPLQVSSFDP